MSPKFVVSLCAAAALLAACVDRDTDVRGDTPGATSGTPDTDTTPGGMAGETDPGSTTTPATPPDTKPSNPPTDPR